MKLAVSSALARAELPAADCDAQFSRAGLRSRTRDGKRLPTSVARPRGPKDVEAAALTRAKSDRLGQFTARTHALQIGR